MYVFSVAYLRALACAPLLILLACANDPSGTVGGTGGGGTCQDADCADGGASGGQNQDGSGGSGGSNGELPDGGDGDELVECAKVEVEAKLVKKPVDIIWVVDSSGSMSGEAKLVQTNMNSFAARIAASGLDYRVVVITKRGFLTVPDPLGSDPAHFLFVDEDVASNEPLDAFIKRFADYASFLRPDAITHLVPVTDDEARKQGNSGNREAMTRDWFLAEMSRLLQHDFTLHAVASESPKCKGATSAGVIYHLLAAATSGLTFSICSADWSALFDGLVSAVVISSPIECSFDLPAAPAGMTLDKDKVNVHFTASGAGNATVIGRTPGADQCHGGGWYYDDANAPKRILICDTTCGELRKQTDVAIDIQLGCGTQVILQ